MSLHSIEVVNSLTCIDLPDNFLHQYIGHCITSCLSQSDKNLQGRCTRLVCVLIQSLIIKNVLTNRDQLAVIQSFCLTFIKVKEAAELYKLIKASSTGSEI